MNLSHNYQNFKKAKADGFSCKLGDFEPWPDIRLDQVAERLNSNGIDYVLELVKTESLPIKMFIKTSDYTKATLIINQIGNTGEIKSSNKIANIFNGD